MSVPNIGATVETKGAVTIGAILLIVTVGISGAALGVGPDAAPQTGAAQQESPLETAVSLEPSSATVAIDQTTTYDVIVDTANRGVGAYDFTVSVADSNVASISDVAVGGDPSDRTTVVSIADDGSSADATAALADTKDTGSVTIATVTVQGDEVGISDIGLIVEALGTETGESYAVTETTDASITVKADDPVPEPDAASFKISNLSAPDTAQLPDPANAEGIKINVSADVTNAGGQTGTQTVELRVDNQADGQLESDEWISRQEVTLDSGETQTVEFGNVDTRDMASPFGVFSANDSATGRITLEEPDEDESEPTPTPETSVSIEPGSAAVNQGETATFDVVVANADGGVGAYDFTVTAFGSSITDVAVQGNPPEETTDVSVADDGSSADVAAALADTDDTGSTTVATVTIRGDLAEAEHDVGLSVDALGTETGDSYAINEVNGATITVVAPDDDDDGVSDPEPEPEPDPADFRVSNLIAPDSAAQGDAIDVSADVTNDGEQEATQSVEFRLDTDGDGTLEDDETLTSQDVTLGGGETQSVSFEDIDTTGLDAGDYTHGVVTDDDSATATITIDEESDDEETIYWQVDFGEGDSPPTPPSYHPNDLMAAIGNSDDGVTRNPSLRRQESDGQLGDVTVVDEEFKFDDEGNPTEVTVDFEIDEGGEARDLHLAVFVLPGPFDVDEIDQQELYEATNGTYEGGDTGELTVSIPQEDGE